MINQKCSTAKGDQSAMVTLDYYSRGCTTLAFPGLKVSPAESVLPAALPAAKTASRFSVVDVSLITRQCVVGPPVSWVTPNGPFTVEHLAAVSPTGDLLVFWWSPQHDWQSINVTAITGQKIASALTSWQTPNGPYLVEHLAAMSPGGDLLVFWWSPQHDWQVVNVTAITGKKIASALTSWQTPNGPYTVEHLAGVSPDGDLLVFWWSPQHDWQSINVTAITGKKIASALTSWQTPNGPYLVEHLAAMNPTGDLLVFWWSPQHDWQSVNVSAITGQRIAAAVTSWQTVSGPYNVEHLAGTGPEGDLHVFWWSPLHDWQSINVTRITGRKVAGTPTVYTAPEDSGIVEILGCRGPYGELLLHWWKPALDWQVLDLSAATGAAVASDATSWLVSSAGRIVEHLACAGPQGQLLVFWGYSLERELTDGLHGPYQTVQPARRKRHKVLTILWDPHKPGVPAPSKQDVEAVLFGPTNSVRAYFLENSRGAFTIENAGILGWYDSDYPPAEYWPPMGGVGRDSGTEAIRRAAQDIDLSSFDIDGDANLEADELGILFILPGLGAGGGLNRIVDEDYVPRSEASGIVVDGVKITWIAEVSIGSPPMPGIVAHELGHLLLSLGDMYFTFFNPASAGQYSIMDQFAPCFHLDPFGKLKLGWLQPRIVFRTGSYRLPAVETTGTVLILMDIGRATDEYFIVENRFPGNSFDAGMFDAGLGVWHVMEDPAVYNAALPPPNVPVSNWAMIGSGWSRRAIRMIRPLVALPFNDGEALWDGTTGFDLVSSDSDPTHGALRWGDGSPSGFAVREISASSAEMTLWVDVPDSAPGTTAPHRICRGAVMNPVRSNPLNLIDPSSPSDEREAGHKAQPHQGR